MSRFASDVRRSLALQPRQLPSQYLYDPLGSALFEAICRLPCYRLARAETRLLRRHAHEIVHHSTPPERIVELGSGSGDKLAAFLSEGRLTKRPLTLHLVDVSPAALAAATRALAAFTAVQVVAHQATYEAGLDSVNRSPAHGRTLVLFLGSNIGNFDARERDVLLRQIRQSLRPGDTFLLGADLVKPERELLLAYDDPLGVTAAFNLNLLVRLNRELDADIDLRSFVHRAVWNQAASRVEMHLVSTRRQPLRIPVADVDIVMAEGEAIWTESSYKFEPEALLTMLARAGFRARTQWVDEDARFALTLVAVP